MAEIKKIKLSDLGKLKSKSNWPFLKNMSETQLKDSIRRDPDCQEPNDVDIKRFKRSQISIPE